MSAAFLLPSHFASLLRRSRSMRISAARLCQVLDPAIEKYRQNEMPQSPSSIALACRRRGAGARVFYVSAGRGERAVTFIFPHLQNKIILPSQLLNTERSPQKHIQIRSHRHSAPSSTAIGCLYCRRSSEKSYSVPGLESTRGRVECQNYSVCVHERYRCIYCVDLKIHT